MPLLSDQTFLHLSDLHLTNTLDGLSYDVQTVRQLRRVLAAAPATDATPTCVAVSGD